MNSFLVGDSTYLSVGTGGCLRDKNCTSTWSEKRTPLKKGDEKTTDCGSAGQVRTDFGTHSGDHVEYNN